jgi:hypothetical protein
MASVSFAPGEPDPATGPAAPPPGWGPVLAIVGANVVTLVMAVALDWRLPSLLWPYWLQSVVIGVFSGARILALRNFSTAYFMINGRPVEPTSRTRTHTAAFFALHYGMFHFGYAVFLLVLATPRLMDLPWYTVALVGFVLGHQRSYREHVERDLAGRPNIGVLVFLPYARVVPMHLVVVGGALWAESASMLVVAAFVVMKTGADLAMHAAEHKLLGGRRH